MNLPNNALRVMAELNEKEQNFGEICSQSEDGTVSLSSVAGRSATASTAKYDGTELQGEWSETE
jgi:hypothetical protein